MRDANAHKFPRGIASAHPRGHAVVDPACAVADPSGPVDCARHLVFADHAAGYRLPVSHAVGDADRATDQRGLL